MMYSEAIIITILANAFVATTGQYVDIFQGLQAFLQPFQLNTDTNPYYDITTRKSTTRKHNNRRPGEVTRPYNFLNNYNLFSTTIKPTKKSTTPNSSHNQSTTRKPNKKTEITRLPWEDNNYNNQTPKNNSNSNSNKNNNNKNNYSGTNTEYNNKRPSNYNNDQLTTVGYAKPNNYVNKKPNDRQPINPQTGTLSNKNNSDVNNLSKVNEPVRDSPSRNVNVSQFITTNNNRGTTRPNIKGTLSTDGKQRPNHNTFTTKRSYVTRPGVKPAPVDENQPPITNKPINQLPHVGSPRPIDAGSYTERPITTPTIEIGPDEDDMTPAERRRYLDLAELMCDNYKALSVKEVVALPLVPSPEGVAVNVSHCTPLNIALIIGGKVSTIEEFPHMALIGWLKTQQDGYTWKCGGSLISDQYILTAGHCTYHEKDYNVVSGPPHAVQLGSSLVDNPDALIVKVASVIRHPKYKQRRSYFDVALIKMVSRVTFSETIRPACLGVPPRVGRPIIATGWGRTELGGDQSNELRSVSLPIWDLQDCRRIWGTSLKLPNGPTSESHVCAGDKEGGKDTCQGDSGGPAQVQEGCAWRIVAVTSYGRSCGAPQTPALYATIPIAFVAAQVFGKQRIANNPKKQDNNGYGTQQYQSASQQQQSNNNFGSQQQNINKYGNQQQNNEYTNQQIYKNQYETPYSSNNDYTNTQDTSNYNQQYNNQFSQEQNNVNKYENQQQTTPGYSNQQRNDNKYSKQQQNNEYTNQQNYKNQYETPHSSNNDYTNTQDTNNYNQQYNNKFSQEQNNVNKYANQQQTTPGYSNQQRNDNKYSKQQQNNDYTNQQDNKNQYESPQSSNNYYTNTQDTNNYNQQYNDQYTQQQRNVNKYINQQETTTRYNNQQQNDNKYGKQQSDEVYGQNSNIYQQLSNNGNQQQAHWWNKQNGNTGDEIPVGGWTTPGGREQNGYVTTPWSYWRDNQEGNYFGSTARPWWAR